MHRLAGESGFALVTAMIILFIITALTGAAITVAVQTSTSTTRDTSVKAELAAAEAGLQVASFRLTQLKPEKTQCINEGADVTTGCKDSPESLGNNATFQYWTTLPLNEGAKCAGVSVVGVAEATQRCVTSEGKVNGVEPGVRLQSLVTSSAGEALFPIKGIVGLEEVLLSGSVKSPELVASNGTIKIKGGAELIGGYELGPKGSFVHEGGAKWNPPEKKRTEAEGPIVAKLPANHATAATNEDSRIGTLDEFYTEGKATNYFKSATDELKLSSNSKLTLGGSKYYLCNFVGEHAGKLIIPAGAHVEIFIDAPPPEDPTSTCPAGTGKFESAEFTLENNAYNPAALLIVMYGKGPVTLGNGGALEATHPFEASIYAPQAEVKVTGAKKFKGGILAKKVDLGSGASVFEWSEEVGGLSNGVPTGYGRKAWAQCTPGSGGSETC